MMIDAKELKEMLDAQKEYLTKERVIPIAPACTETMSISKAEYFLLLEENAEMKCRLARLELERNEKQKEL